MRLINTKTLRLEEFPDERNVKYAILSHRWEHEEVLFMDMMLDDDLRKARAMHGFYKIRMCCSQAASEGLDYAWVDTCCIDKSSSAELQEAINSMYRWYKSAEICYAYLSDVDTHKTGFHSIGTSMWFDRAWTLQELVVPSSLVFLSNNGARFGSRSVLAPIIHQRTRIPLQVLRDGFEQGKSALVAEIMSWARFRQATRSEDHAYSLLGLFNVSMPLLYGEGCQAFRRLQEEILKQSQDQSIFVWYQLIPWESGLLAPMPGSFYRFPGHAGFVIQRRKAASAASDGVTLEVILVPWAPNTFLAHTQLSTPTYSRSR